ncbi:MAG: hypothetical protein LUH12_00635 [Bacteroides sp.]|jgi:hypothetical protein|nr:hypothetical protein [Phocaeicola barnesiae]MCD7815246.1 hypothetical protein [Bacteroides sp.]
MENANNFEEIIRPEDRLNEELLEDLLGGAECRTGKTVECDPTGII